MLICAACGTKGFRPSASYCPVCGKAAGEGYEPLDALRSGYDLQRADLATSLAPSRPGVAADDGNHPVADAAWALVVYSMVPYLGILFTPFALGTAAYAIGMQVSGRRLAKMSLGIGIATLAVQLLLWWLLYVIPELSGVPG
jgi:hypothetical protein